MAVASQVHQHSSNVNVNADINPSPNPKKDPAQVPLRTYDSLPGLPPTPSCPNPTPTPGVPGAGASLPPTTDAHRRRDSTMTTTLQRPILSSSRRRQSENNTGMLAPFAGRLGGNQSFILDRSNPANAELLRKVPDAAPNLNLKEMFDLGGFREVDMYKAAVVECFGTMILVFGSAYDSLSPGTPPPKPSATSGVFSTTSFLGPLVAACINTILITLLIYCFGAISGAHLNPLITFATFFARLATFPRLVLYVAAQTLGGTLAGLLLRAAAGTRFFKVGGCFLFIADENGARGSVSSQFVIEFMGSLLLLVMAFGVGLDPRQKEIFGPALAPILVGLAAGGSALCFAFSTPGSGGAGLNPARCFGVFVGSRFPGWHWVNWVGPLAASMLHGIVYWIVPPGSSAQNPNYRMARASASVVDEADEKRIADCDTV
ncbi:hypothetical protein LTR96_000879 [Exophiala xenobiotica]|nr:hypothetical protein LTR96_000879 [Exophiala xenobiotica]KAK5343607.1 hypothetical protein LTR98_001236 [Exophiala xenobiotica]KAK5559250.1 hypothetical protein LTR46_002292 [Exophiala xenobiotica]